MPQNHKVNVPQKDGEITITQKGEARSFKVTDGTVSVPADDLSTFLAHVDGATEANPPAAKKD